jgi:hypothetical protein
MTPVVMLQAVAGFASGAARSLHCVHLSDPENVCTLQFDITAAAQPVMGEPFGAQLSRHAVHVSTLDNIVHVLQFATWPVIVAWEAVQLTHAPELIIYPSEHVVHVKVVLKIEQTLQPVTAPEYEGVTALQLTHAVYWLAVPTPTNPEAQVAQVVAVACDAQLATPDLQILK